MTVSELVTAAKTDPRFADALEEWQAVRNREREKADLEKRILAEDAALERFREETAKRCAVLLERRKEIEHELHTRRMYAEQSLRRAIPGELAAEVERLEKRSSELAIEAERLREHLENVTMLAKNAKAANAAAIARDDPNAGRYADELRRQEGRHAEATGRRDAAIRERGEVLARLAEIEAAVFRS